MQCIDASQQVRSVSVDVGGGPYVRGSFDLWGHVSHSRRGLGPVLAVVGPYVSDSRGPWNQVSRARTELGSAVADRGGDPIRLAVN